MIKLREIRERKKITQQELAKKLNTTQTSIYRYEKGTRKLNSDQIIEFVKILNCTADELLGIAKNLNEEKKDE